VRALRSVLDQTYKDIEVIIVDDNDGTDEYRIATQRQLQSNFGSKSVIYLTHSYNKGLPAARNTGIKAAKGEYIAFLDDDDEWLPQKLEKQLALFTSLPDDYGVVSCGWNLIHSVNQYTKQVYPNFRGDLSAKLALNHFSPPSMILVKKHFLEMVSGFDEEFKWREDIELYYRLSRLCLFDFVDECMVNYYYHSESMSRNFSQKLIAVDQFIRKHEDTLIKNRVPWSEIHERKGDLAAASGKLSVAIQSLIKAYSCRPRRIQILGKLLLSLFGSSHYVKTRRL
jgi:glycosyltransferase involved in cell wall biosynthesis